MTRPLISVVTPSYNHAHFIRRTIDSVLDQKGEFDIDYRVIDGGSNDGTVEILQSYGNAFQWVSEKDKGQVDAINKGLRQATGDIIGWVNSDDLLLPGALARVAEAFTRHPEAEWVHGRCRIIDEHDVPVRGWVSLYKHLRARTHTFENYLTENYISQMTTFWRHSVHAEVGYLSPEFDLTFDYEFFLRLAERGDPIYLEQELACFRWYETSKSGAGFRKQVDQAIAIAARYNPTLGVRLRRQATKHAMVNVYRVLSLARTALDRVR